MSQSYDRESGSRSPVLLYNDNSQGIKVLSSLQSSMDFCDGFDFSVAFVTMGGLSTLYQSFRNLQERGIKGRILTTDYLSFNDPDALKWLLEHTNHEIRVCEEKFHTKGYLFYKEDEMSALIGSSNLTDKALCENLEWNLRVDSAKNDSVSKSIRSEFERMWNGAVPLTEEWIENYRKRYENKPTALPQQQTQYTGCKIQPNIMQQEAIASLKKLRDEGKSRALLISATGTGKTPKNSASQCTKDSSHCLIHSK